MLRMIAVMAATLSLIAIGLFAHDAEAAETKIIDGDAYTCTFEGLRFAVGDAEDGDTITFDCPAPNNIFELTGDRILIDNGKLTIDGANGNADQIVLNRSQDSTENNRFLTVENGGDLLLKNITIQNGKINEEGGDERGAAIFSDGTLTIENGTFTGNETVYGAVIYLQSGSTATITGSTFSSNRALSQGDGDDGNGAIFVNDEATLNLNSTDFTSNTSTAGGGAIFVDDDGHLIIDGGTFSKNSTPSDGGAIYIDNSDVVASLTNVNFEDNRATNGGAIFVDADSSLTVNDGQFSNNHASAPDGTSDGDNLGGAIHFNNQSSGNITGATFTANRGGHGGALFLDDESTVTILDSNFTSNSTTDSGGGIRVDGAAALTVTGGTFLNNSGNDGGAIAVIDDGALQVDGTTFTDNASISDGGAIWINSNGGEADVPLIKNATFDGNTALDDGGALYTRPGSSVSIVQSIFSANEAVPRDENGQMLSGDGGAIFNLGTMSVTGSQFTKNRSSLNDAGAIFSQASLEVINSIFTENWACSSGGAIVSMVGSTLTVKNSEFINNRADTGEGGAIVAFDHISASVAGSSFHGNTSADHGGALANQIGQMLVSQSSFYSNSTEGIGGAIYNTGALEVESTTFSLNNAAQGAAAIDGCDCGDAPTVEIRWSTIVQNDSPAIRIIGPTELIGVILTGTSESCAFDVSSDQLTASLSVIDDDSCQLGIPPVPLPIVGLQQSQNVNGVVQAFHPVIRNGPAHDTGGSSCPALDQLGETRPQGDNCEIGAIEHLFVDYDPITLCANRWNGQLSMGGPSDCGRGDTVVNLPSATFEPVEFCVNQWNGAIRLKLDGSPCGRSEWVLAVSGFGDESFCVNNWNGTIRYSDHCSRSEHQVHL